MKKYKLRVYFTYGIDRGKLDHEEFFDTREEMDRRYKKIFVHKKYSCRPTAYEWNGNDWDRIEGY